MAAEAGYPRVFISYTHETPSHESRVLELAQWLRDRGVDCRIDQFEQFPAEGWTKWMRNQIRQAEFVLVVCTEPYLRRFEGEEVPGIGRGATWEGTIISLELYREALRNTKFVPVILSSTDEANIPDVLRDYQHFDVSVEVDKDKLYRLLMGQPEVTPHPVGRPRRPARRRAQKVVLFHETGRADQWNHPGSATRD